MAITPAPPAMPAWSVVGQTETIQPSPTGSGVVSGVQVSYTTTDGHTGTVFVPDTQYNPDTVRQLINARVALVSQVGRLSSAG